ncbi:hypothetical protein G9A89_002438 [Geosiphon pyriformis]|nr:hypothetical protein G9A89_002438 [Geosiphon pyriformis]
MDQIDVSGNDLLQINEESQKLSALLILFRDLNNQWTKDATIAQQIEIFLSQQSFPPQRLISLLKIRTHDPECACLLALLYCQGIGTEEKHELAFDLYKKTAQAGDFLAQIELGLCYENGTGTKVDNIAAFDWYQKASDAGFGGGHWFLGVSYEAAIGVYKNDEKAFELYQKAIQCGCKPAALYIAGYYFRGIWPAKKDRRKAFQLVKMSADFGYSDSFTVLGRYYHQGFCDTKDIHEALKMYRKGFDRANDHNAHHFVRMIFKQNKFK